MSNIAFWITLGGVLTVAILAYRSAKKAQAQAIVRKRTNKKPEATTPESPGTYRAPKAKDLGD